MSITDLYDTFEERFHEHNLNGYIDSEYIYSLTVLEHFSVFKEKFDFHRDTAFVNNTWYDSDDGSTILMELAYAGNLEFVKFLVEAGADVNVVNKDGDFALHYAAVTGHKAIFEYLYPLTRKELREKAKTHLSRGEKLAKERNQYLIDTLILAAQNGNIEQLKAVIVLGVNVNAANPVNGEVAIHEACKKGHAEVVQVLLDAGADINREVNGETPLSVARQSNQLEVVQLLLANGATPLT